MPQLEGLRCMVGMLVEHYLPEEMQYPVLNGSLGNGNARQRLGLASRRRLR